jgi:hypothetical protein
MHVHLPKPLHGWRALLGEIGVIVIGVLIALAAEQAVEWLHWRQEASETRQALHRELARAVGAYQFREAHQDCADRRLDELTRWLDASQPGDRLALARPIVGPLGFNLGAGAWEAAKSGQAAWRMPLEERMHYTLLYASLTGFNQHQLADIDLWREMGAYGGTEPLDHGDRMRLRGLIMRAREHESVMRLYPQFIMPEAAALSVTPQQMSTPDAESSKSFCQPLFAAPENKSSHVTVRTKPKKSLAHARRKRRG